MRSQENYLNPHNVKSRNGDGESKIFFGEELIEKNFQNQNDWLYSYN